MVHENTNAGRSSRLQAARRVLRVARTAEGRERKPRISVRSLNALLGGTRWRVITLAACATGSALAEAAFLVLVVRLTLAISTGDDRVDLDVGPLDGSASIGTLLAAGLVLAVVRLALQLVAAYLPARMSTDVQEQFRRSIFEHYVHATWDLQSQEREGHLQELLTTQVDRAAVAVLLLSHVITAGFNFTTLMISAVILNAPAAMSILIAVVAFFFLLRPLARLIRHQSARQAAEGLAYAGSISEAVRIAEELQSFGVEEQQRHIVDRRAQNVSHYHFRTELLRGILPAVYQNAAIIVIVGGLAVVYLTGSAQVASLGAIALILLRALGYSQTVQDGYHRANAVLPYVENLLQRQADYEVNRARSGDEALTRIEELRFEGVWFEYEPGVPRLKNVSLRFARGDAIGVVGPTGAGKSTLIQLILRLRRPSRGEFLVNGRPAAQFRLADWRRLVAFVPQDPKLLSGTVADNIRFLRDGISDEEVEGAARLAHIHDEICSWPLGYRTVVDQRANAVSGGQRQRICLARALVTRPSVLVLDEPTSALDIRSESLIQRSLEASKGEMTILCIAHRLSTLNLCDRIIVLRDGMLEAFDTADSLVRSNGFYREAVELSRLP